jgi:ABC-type transport system involved in cytochrome c biogenesis permease component
MYIHRGLLIVLLVIFIFAPAIYEWVGDNQAAWYRPYIAWLFMILAAYLGQRRSLRKAHDD